MHETWHSGDPENRNQQDMRTQESQESQKGIQRREYGIRGYSEDDVASKPSFRLEDGSLRFRQLREPKGREAAEGWCVDKFLAWNDR